jgi:hypothetical protein
MAEDYDLCKPIDVQEEGHVDQTIMDAHADDIAWHISDESEEILTTVNPNVTSTDRHARKAVAFAVLSWMQSQDLIPSTTDPVMVKDGDFQVTYTKTNDATTENSERKSYEEQAKYHRAFITPNVIGSDPDITATPGWSPRWF